MRTRTKGRIHSTIIGVVGGFVKPCIKASYPLLSGANFGLNSAVSSKRRQWAVASGAAVEPSPSGQPPLGLRLRISLTKQELRRAGGGRGGRGGYLQDRSDLSPVSALSPDRLGAREHLELARGQRVKSVIDQAGRPDART